VVVPEALAAKVALVAPGAMVTPAGMERAAVPPDNTTADPAAGAAAESATVQVAELPLATIAALQDKLVNCAGAAGGFSEIEAVCVTVFAEAVIMAD
jgi:hypothetical protein